MKMNQLINAVYENGVLKPEKPLNLPEGTRVQVYVESPPPATDMDCAWEEWDRLCDEIRLDANVPRLTRDQLHERR
jgi:predicted DNA-binding antitoxin AbrB/MazE fold protein